MRATLVIVALLCTPCIGQEPKILLLNTRHDFSVRSAATIRASIEDKSCVFCHVPHNGTPSVPLWNHTATDLSLQPYSSSTLSAPITSSISVNSSKLCLSCHDGTVALGDTVNNGVIPFIQGAGYTIPTSSGSDLNNGGGLSDDHPFAFTPILGTEITDPPPGDSVKLDAFGQIQCVTCHDPHVESKDSTSGKFLVKPNIRSAICVTCHTVNGWSTASHQQPASSVDDARYGAAQGAHTGYVGMSNNGCESCHRPHSPTVGQRLIKFVEEDTCYKCHNGSVADANRNIEAEFETKTYRHPVYTTPSVHDASEGPTSVVYRLPEISPGIARHSECVDCHNSHAATSQPASPPLVSGFLQNVTGITSSGVGITNSLYEFQICLKCHGDSANQPQIADSSVTGIGFGRNPQRLTDQGNPSRCNLRLEFTSIVSWHPVISPRGLSTGTSGDVSSLRPAPISSFGQPLPGRTLSASSLVYCSDCHNNDTGRNLGTGSGPVGPHGSNTVHLLERSYSYNVPPSQPGAPFAGVPYSPGSYALCDKCHDISGSVVQDTSFSKHNLHVVTAGASCSICHAVHGINGGNSINNSHLINFDLSIVGPDQTTGLLKYESLGFKSGRCYLQCHGVNHSPKSY